MKWTERQYEAISARDTTLLVSAAAGSGKTAVLVERVKRLLIEDGIDIDRMLVVTFTNAAASEMKEKISRMLSAALTDPATDPEKISFIRHQADLLGRADICTFHSFALELLRKYYHVIGADPDIAVCDEEKQKILMNDAMEEMFEARYESGDADFLSFLDHYADSRNDRKAKDMIAATYRFIQSLPDPEGWLSRASSASVFDVDSFLSLASEYAQEELSAVISYLRAAAGILSSAPGNALHKLSSKHALDIEKTETVLRQFSELSSEAGFGALSSGISWEQMRASGGEKLFYEPLKDSFSALRDKGKERFKALRSALYGIGRESLETEKMLAAPQLKILCSLTSDLSARFARKKRERHLLDFSDIEHLSLKILENEEVRRECREHFEYIFVDEYQDSNLVQESLIQRICRPDNVFMVGDVKQSIYKFRLAEPELFIGKYKDIKAGLLPQSRAVDLNSNFRSKAPVIGYVNEIFSSLMSESGSGLAYDDDSMLVEGAPYTGACLYEPKLYLVAGRLPEAAAEEDEEIEELRADELEALNSVKLIKEYLGKPIFDAKKGIERPLRYGDMVILMRAAKSRAEVYYRALSDAGIPVLLERSEGYFDAAEIQVFMNLLRLIDNRQKDVPLLSVLRFPSFGFNADELSEIRIWADSVYPPGNGRRRLEYNRAFSLYARDGRDPALRERCAAFLEKLSGWRLRSLYGPLGDFLWSLLGETGIDSFCSALPAGKQRRANLTALINKAESFEESSASGLYGFISYIDIISDGKLHINTGQARMDPGESDAVRIMTIHKSKGLEFPFVLLAGLGGRLKKAEASSSALFDKECGVGLRLSDPEKELYSDPVSARLIKLKKAKEERAEDIRVLYVALTRAKDILLLSGCAADPQKKLALAELDIPGDVSASASYLDMLLPVLGRGRADIVYPDGLKSASAQEGRRRGELMGALENGFDAVSPSPSEDEIKKRLSAVYFDSTEEGGKRKYSVSQLAELERADLHDVPRVLAGSDDGEERIENAPVFRKRRLPAFLGTEKRLSAAQRGTAYHSVMEHIPFDAGNKSEDDIARFIDGLVERNILSPAEADAVAPERISAFFRSEIGKRALASPEIYREAPFVFKRMYNGREILVQGTLDCYFKEGDEIVIVDYKSDYVDCSDIESAYVKLKESYIPQLALYKEALERVQGRKVKEAVLYLFSVGAELRIC